MKCRALLGLSAGVLLGAVVTAPAVSASPPPSATEVVMAAGPVAAAGLDGNAPVSISLRVKDARGAAVCPFHDPPGLYVDRVKAVLERTAGGPRDSVDAWLTRASGTEQDGTWTGQWRAGSTRSGTWSLVRVEWCVLDGDNERTTQVVPSPIRSVVVTGSQAPRLTWRRVPAVAAYNARQWVEYTVRDATGHRLAGLPITLGHIYPAAGDSDSWSGAATTGTVTPWSPRTVRAASCSG